MSARPVTYFDNAATSWPKPPAVAREMARFLQEEAANPGRGLHRMAVSVSRRIEALRARVAELLHAEAPARIAFTLNASDALNQAIHGVVRAARRAEPGLTPRVVTSDIEHNSVTRPLNHLEREGAIELHRVACGPSGVLDVDRVLSACDVRTRLVALTHASNVLGTIQPIEAIARGLRERFPDALLLVDAAQTVGAVPIDVRALGADLLAAPGHKALLGPTGTGLLYIGPRAFDAQRGVRRIDPTRHGGTGGDSTNPFMPDELPHCFEAGTPNTVGLIGLLAAFDHHDPGAIDRERAHVQRLLEAARTLPGVRIAGGMTSADHMVGAVSLFFENADSATVAAVLDESFSIAARSGLMCAPGCHRAVGTFPGGTVRLSPGAFTTDRDVEGAIAALRAIAADLG